MALVWDYRNNEFELVVRSHIPGVDGFPRRRFSQKIYIRGIDSSVGIGVPPSAYGKAIG